MMSPFTRISVKLLNSLFESINGRLLKQSGKPYIFLTGMCNPDTALSSRQSVSYMLLYISLCLFFLRSGFFPSQYPETD